MIPKTQILNLVFVLFLAGCSTLPKGAQVEKVHFSQEVKSLVGDLYLPKAEEKTPVVIVVHGGGWSSRTGDMESICKKLVRRGIAAFNITYRLAPENKYPKAVNDVKAAMDWIKENGARYNIDTQRMGGWGYSAGAHLILLSGLNPEQGLKAIVAGGTPAQLTYWPKSPMIGDFIGHPMATHKKIWEEASPINHVREKSPPVYLYHGAWDTLVDYEQMGIMEKALKKKGVEVKTYSAPLMGHFMVYLLSFKSDRLGLDFLVEKLNKT